jgi:hypothetical protein
VLVLADAKERARRLEEKVPQREEEEQRQVKEEKSCRGGRLVLVLVLLV